MQVPDPKMIRLITQEQIRQKTEGFIEGDFGTPAREALTLLEVSPNPSFNQCHIKRAIHLPPEHLREKAKAFLPNLNAEIVLYGESESSEETQTAAQTLAALGYADLYVYLGGKKEWKRLGLPTECSLVPADGFQVS